MQAGYQLCGGLIIIHFKFTCWQLHLHSSARRIEKIIECISVVTQSCYGDRMGLEKSIREGSCQKTISCLSRRLPRGVFKSQSGNLSVWKVEQERNRLICKDPERNGLTLTCPSHAGCRGRAEGLKKQRDSWTWIGVEKGACCLRTSPVSLAHASEEFSTSTLGFTQSILSQWESLWFSLCFGLSPFKTSSG